MSTILPQDNNNHAIPVLRLKPGGAHAVAATAVSARVGPFDPATRVIGLYATGPVFVRSGDATVSAAATDHFLPEGFYYDISLGHPLAGPVHTYLAVLRADTDCTLYISEKE